MATRILALLLGLSGGFAARYTLLVLGVIFQSNSNIVWGQRRENIFCNGTVLIVVRHTAVVPRRRFTGNPTHPLRKDCPGSGGVAFSPGPVRLRAHRTRRQVRRWSVGHDAPGRPRRDKSRLVDSKAAGRALALGTRSRPAFKTKVKRSTT
jgi:hypothetical protein